jgi:hypothetical protein
MKRAVCWAVSMAVTGMLFAAAQARADQVPGGCRSNDVELGITRDVDTVRNGDLVHFTVVAANVPLQAGDLPCNITDMAVTLQLPAADGTPTGQIVTISTSASVAAYATGVTIGTVPWTVALNPNVPTAKVQAVGHGVLHDQAFTTDTADPVKTLSVGAIYPGLTMTKTASVTSGTAPVTTTYTYTVTNVSTTPTDAIAQLNVIDNLCSPVAPVKTAAGHNAGDANANDLLDIGETFTFTCVSTFTSPGTYTNTANACGSDTIDKRPVCAGPVTATVHVTSPPVVAASKPNKCVSVPKTLSLRAKELTTVKVTVDTGDGPLKGAKVTIKGPGISRSATTNSKGVATFRVRPTKKGTLTITSDRCLQAMQSSVKAARRTQSRQVPKNTG